VAVLDVMCDAGEPLGPGEVRSLVAKLLDQTVSQDTVSSFVSVAVRDPSMPIERLADELYKAAISEALSRLRVCD